MKIKIVQPGWEAFTGNFGSIEFQGGVSVAEVSNIEASRVAAVVRVETLEGKDPSMAQRIIDAYHEPAPEQAATVAVAELPSADKPCYTAEELSAVADKHGIKGLREIADPLGIKANSISELIARVLAVCQRAPVAAQTSAEG